MQTFYKNTIFIIIWYIPILYKLKINNISNIKIFNFKNWHHGYAYFLAKYNNKPIFLKIDTDLHLLANDKLVFDIYKNSTIEHNLVNILQFSLIGKIQFIAYEFLDGLELNEELLIESPLLIDEIIIILHELQKNNLIHRDIKLDNFFLVNGKLKIIDFTFTMSNADNSFKEVDISKASNCTILAILGNELNPKPFYWDDAYSLLSIIKKIALVVEEKEKKEIFNSYAENIKNMLNKNIYKTQCSSTYYYKKKKMKFAIKNFINKV